MARQLNPWPAFADLFSMLAVASVASLVVITAGAGRQSDAEIEAKGVVERLAKEFQKRPTTVNVGTCQYASPDTCVDIRFRFSTGSAELDEEGKKEIQDACALFSSAIDSFPHKSEIALVIEGHADDQPGTKDSVKDRELRNWKLSSDRADEVLYQFRQRGMDEKKFNISASGFADTRPLPCQSSMTVDECRERNRRTTMRLRADLSAIQQRLSTVQ